jgi:hypothetical protein
MATFPRVKAFFAGFLAGAVIVCLIFAFCAFWPRPGPEEPVVIVDPSPAQAAQAEVHANEQIAGHMAGQVQIKPIPPAAIPIPSPRPPEPPEDHPHPPEIVHPAPSSGADPGPSSPLVPGYTVTVPQEGAIEVKWTDAKTGKTIGEGSYPVSGETVFSVGKNWALTLNTTFGGAVEIAIDVPAPPRWWVGVAAQASLDGGLHAGVFVDYRREVWRIGRFTVMAGAGAEVYLWPDTDIEVTIRAGLAF